NRRLAILGIPWARCMKGCRWRRRGPKVDNSFPLRHENRRPAHPGEPSSAKVFRPSWSAKAMRGRILFATAFLTSLALAGCTSSPGGPTSSSAIGSFDSIATSWHSDAVLAQFGGVEAKGLDDAAIAH